MPSCGKQERWVGSLDLTHSRPAQPAAPPNGKLYYVVQVRYRVSSPKYLWLEASEPVLRVWEKKKNRPCSLMPVVVGKYARQFWRALPGRNDEDKQADWPTHCNPCPEWWLWVSPIQHPPLYELLDYEKGTNLQNQSYRIFMTQGKNKLSKRSPSKR